MAQLVDQDPYLKPYLNELTRRSSIFQSSLEQLNKIGGLEQVSRKYKYYGIHLINDKIVYREWAPAAKRAWFVGDFSQDY